MKTLDKKILNFLFSEKASDSDRKGFLLNLNRDGVTAQQIADLVKFLLPRNFPSEKFTDAIDICGTGGSGLPRINVSTISAFILSTAGVKIAKHGNRAASGRCGSFDLLEKLGLKIEKTADELASNFARENLAFIFAPMFFPPMRFFATVRGEIGVPTIFNLLGPLLNPAQPAVQIIGTNSPENAEKICRAAKILKKKRCAVVVGENGLDEICLSGKTLVLEFSDDSEIKKREIFPKDFGFEKLPFEKFSGGGAEENLKIAESILRGENSPHADLVAENCAFVLHFLNRSKSLPEGVEITREILQSKKAEKILEKMREI